MVSEFLYTWATQHDHPNLSRVSLLNVLYCCRNLKRIFFTCQGQMYLIKDPPALNSHKLSERDAAAEQRTVDREQIIKLCLAT